MRAVVIREFGPPRVLEPAEVQEPAPGPGEVVIDVEFANVTFVETQVRAGKAPHKAMLPALPAILGNGVGGTLAEGAAGRAGRRVVASLGGTGGYAERAVVPAGRLIEVPAGVSLRDVDAEQPTISVPEPQAVFLEMLIRAAFADPGAHVEAVVRDNPEPPGLGVEDGRRPLHRLEQPEGAVRVGKGLVHGAPRSALRLASACPAEAPG